MVILVICAWVMPGKSRALARANTPNAAFFMGRASLGLTGNDGLMGNDPERRGSTTHGASSSTVAVAILSSRLVPSREGPESQHATHQYWRARSTSLRRGRPAR